MQQPDADKLEPGSASVSAGADTTPTVQRDTAVLQPDSPISSAGASAGNHEPDPVSEVCGTSADFDADAEDDAAALHAVVEAEAAKPTAEPCCDVQAATPARDQIRALEDSVQRKLDAQQRENESLDGLPEIPDTRRRREAA